MADFTPIRVSELPEVTNVGENDYLVVDDGIQTSKIKSKNYNARSSGSAKEYADEAARSASRATERAEAAAQSVIQVDALAQNASTSANNALNYSRDAEAWAKGTRDGSAVPITDATHENNAKYFAQQAQNSATSAAESADAAEELLVSAIDPTLTQAGKAADAKKTGDELANLSSAIGEAVRFDVAQEKTDAEKAQARANIGIENVEIYAENVVAEYEIVTEPPKTYSQITQTISAASTVSDKAWNCETGAAETQADSVYARFNGLSQYEKIYVDGRGLTPQTTYPLITFYDTNGTKIGISQGDGSWGSVNMIVDVPDGTSYAIVNGSTASSRPIPPAIRGLINGEKIGTMIPLTGTVTEGAKTTDGSIRSGENYYHIRYNTIPDSTYIYVSGVSWGATYPLIFFYNASDQLISSDYAYSASIFYSVELSIPSNTSYFIVNMTHVRIVGQADQGVRYPTSETGRVPTKTQAEYNDELRPLVDKKYLFVGDSYAEGYSHDGRNPGWCHYVVDYLGLDSSQYVTVYTGGYGFANGGFTTLVNGVTDTGITDVIVCGGYNDRSNNEQAILSGITAFKNAVANKWPSAEIHVGFIAYNKQGTGEGSVDNWETIRSNLVNIVLPAYQKSITVGCNYLTNVEYWLGESGLTNSDGYHPSDAGNRAIALGIANALIYGSAPLPYKSDLSALAKSNIFTASRTPAIRESLMAQDNIGIDHTGNVEVFEKLVTPSEVMPLNLYGYSNGQAYPFVAVYGCYKKYAVTPGETYYLTGRHFYTDTPFYILLNQSDGVVSYYDGGSVGFNLDRYKLVIPNNATTLVVNGYYTAYEKITVTQTPEIAQQTVYGGLIALQSGSTTQYEILSSEATYAKCVRFAVSQNTGYCLIGGRHFYTDRPLYIITNASGTVLKYYDGGATGHDSDVCCFAVPANGAYLYVNASKAYVSTVKLYKHGTYDTLHGYVSTKVDKQLSQFTGKIVTPQMFGANPNAAGTNDCSGAIQKAIDAAKGGTVFFPKGNYGISSPIQTYKYNTNYTNLVFADGAKVIALNSMPYMLNLGVLGDDTKVGHVRKILRGGIFDGSNGNVSTAIVHIGSGCMTLDMSDFQIIANGCDGLHVGDSGAPTSVDANIHNGLIIKSNTQNTANSGLKLFGTDNNISDVRVYYFKYNIEVLADTQFLNDMHTLATSTAQNDVSLYVHDGVHINCSNFYGDSESTFVYLGVGSALTANNLYYFSYRSNSVVIFSTHGDSKIAVFGFHLGVKDNNYVGFKMNSGSLVDALSKGNFILSGMDIEGAQYLKNGDPVKCMMASDGQPLFKATAMQSNKWYYVGAYPADASTVHWFELLNGVKRTVIPLSVEYSNGLTDSLLLNSVDTNDTDTFNIGFALQNTSNGYALINVYIKPIAAKTIDGFKICSKSAVGGSSAEQKSSVALASVTITPSITYQVDCANKTITKLS